MKLLKPVFLLLFCFFLTQVASQDCKFPKKMRKHAQKHLENEKIERATKFEVTLRDFSKAGATHFAKSDSGYFLGLSMMRDFSRKSGVMVDNPIVFTLKNDSLVTLYPANAASDRGSMSFITPMGTKILKVYYELSNEQLQLFESMPIKNVKIYMTFQKKAKNGANETDLLDFEIKKEKWRANFMESAKCILQ